MTEPMATRSSGSRAAVPANVREVCATLDARPATRRSPSAARCATRSSAARPATGTSRRARTPEEVIALFRRTIPTGLQHGTVTIVTGTRRRSRTSRSRRSAARAPTPTRAGPITSCSACRSSRTSRAATSRQRDGVRPGDATADRSVRRPARPRGPAAARGRPTGDVYEDAVARFTEDGLRVMRAVRFAAQLEFALDPDTERGICPALPSLAKVARERVRDELRKMLAARAAVARARASPSAPASSA